ncbi:alpha-mannosidase [Holotrichia oblita]|uniref:Alpha-mannosidase n=1 Tax=Holotrichia oblita TaxID=644536 RepID=A0ACB9TS88_HOLOL|nr:alpha-mannosidase [Holotrichia oblita]
MYLQYTSFISYVDMVRMNYKTNNIIITMGGDFTFMEASIWYSSIDALLRYSNRQQKNGSKYNLLYSTPSCYLKAVQEASKGKIKWPVKTDDFFPYASDPHAYWTGYFTSRPTLKRFERLGNNFLQVCKQLYALTDLGPEDWVDLNALREAMGVMQHHDAITGTEKQHVAFDYAKILSRGMEECGIVAKTALGKLVSINPTQQNPQLDVPELNFQSCLLANISECKITEESDKFVVTVYNPLSRNVTHYVRLPVTGTAYKVLDYNGNPIVTQLMPISNTVLNIPGRMSASTVELIFVAKDVPPLGFLSFYVSKTTGNDVMEPKRLHSLSYQSQIGIDPDTGKVNKIKINDQLIPMEQDFYYYRGAVGNNSASEFRSSGAYIFRPNQSTPIQISETAHYELFEGSIVGELRQVFTNWTSQIVRVYKDEEFIEFDWLVGPIPVQDITGKEVITVYNTNLKTDSTFYTDSNGREMLKRVRDYRPTWKLEVNEKVAGNYYPVTSKIVMQDTDKNLEFAVLTDRAQGGTSLEDGEIELMLHRSCLHDDAFGVGENLRELAFGKALVARGSHYLIAGSINGTAGGKTVAAQERDIAQRKLMAAWTFITETSASDFNAYKTQYNMRYAGLLRSLPDNVQILTLEPWKADTFLLRLEHVLEKSEDPILSQPVTVDLKNLFSTFDIIWYNETTLGANEWLSDNEKNKEKYDKILLTKTEKEDLEWQPNVLNDNEIDSNDIYDVFSKNRRSNVAENLLDYQIELKPMQIRTFIIKIQQK